MENTNTITVDIPVDWVDGLALDQDELRQALQLGLTQLRQQQAEQTHSLDCCVLVSERSGVMESPPIGA